MTDYVYGTGEWTALAHGGRAAILDPSIEPPAVQRIWESLSSGGSLESWLEVLAGNGLAALPSFGFVEPGDDGVRVVVRGEVVALVADYDVSAGGMRTWREHVAPAGTGVVLQVEQVEAVYPLIGGVVRAAVLHIGDVDGVGADASAAAAAPVVADVDEAGTAATDAAAAEGAVEQPGDVPEEGVDVVAVESDVSDGTDGTGSTGADESASAEGEAAADPEQADEQPSESADLVEHSEDAAAEPDVDAEAGSDAAADEVNPDEATPAWSDEGDQPEQVAAPEAGDVVAVVPEQAVAPEQDVAPEEAVWSEQQQSPWAAPPAPAADPAQWGPPIPQPEGAAAAHVAEAAPAEPDMGDHDGHTVRASEIPRPGADGPVDATLAPGQEELNELEQQVPVMQLSLSTGQQVALDRPVLIGRAPESSRFGFGETPRLVTVPSPQQDISRTHVEIKVEGDHVLVTDLRSTNGTVVVLPGAPPRRLHPGESVPVPAGTVVDLGDGVTAIVAPPSDAPAAY